ncbi:hypothetical protein BMS3Bbin02_00013 [bacterium BMS3Bbin02]|nr:hypothetical protein BMS3Bbin02_00013 [bacterium BMS3Bbin02]
MPENQITIRVAANGFVVERYKDHALKELWVYMGTGASSCVGICVRGMLDNCSNVDVKSTEAIAADLQKKADRFARKEVQ